MKSHITKQLKTIPALKESFASPTKEDIDQFIRKASIHSDFNGFNTIGNLELTNKMRIDFRDILYSEIMTLPEEMVSIL